LLAIKIGIFVMILSARMRWIAVHNLKRMK
jgi:hypothetical protein